MSTTETLPSNGEDQYKIARGETQYDITVLGTFHIGDDNLTTDLLVSKLAIPYGTKWTDDLLDEAITEHNIQVQLL